MKAFTKSLLMITIYLWLIGCSAENDFLEMDLPVTPIEQTKMLPLPTQEPHPTHTEIAPTLTIEIAPTLIQFNDCNSDCVLFLAEGDGVTHADKTGVYLVSSNGRFIVQIISKEDLLGQDWNFTDMDVSPDGRMLALAANNRVDPLATFGMIYIWDLQENRLINVYSVTDYISLITWSSNGAFLVYETHDNPAGYSRIEALSVETQIISTLLSPSLNIINLDLSHESTQLMYSTFETDGQIDDIRLYLTNLICNSESYQCSIGEPIELGWIDHRNRYRFALVPSKDAIVMAYIDRLADGSTDDFVEVRHFDGEVIGSIGLNSLLPQFSIKGSSPPQTSYTGNLVAFVGLQETDSLYNVYVLDFNEGMARQVTDLQNASVYKAVWLP